MARKYDFIKDISDFKETWRLAVRIIDVWSVVNNRGIEHMEMVIVDSKGDRIQVLVRNDLTSKWKEVIKEDITCIINNGTVYDNDFQWKLTDHPKKFVFLSGTTVKPTLIDDIPPKEYVFKDFAEILQGKCRSDRLEDIIGIVSEVSNVQAKAAGKKVVVSLKLKDLKGNVVSCSLWETYGSQFLIYYNDIKNSGAIVIILTHAMIKDYQLSNGWSGSKLLINEDIPEINKIMSELSESVKIEKPSQSTIAASNWSGGSQYTPVQRFVYNTKCILLVEFPKLKHETLCVTFATTLKLAVTKYGWFYYGCSKCSLKASDSKNSYQCSCGESVEQAVPRYRVEIYVNSGDVKYRFVFWDSDCAAIIGKTTNEVCNMMLEQGEDDPMVYPDDLDIMLDKKMAFRVKVQPSYSQASVYKLETDVAFVTRIEEDYICIENHPNLTNTLASEAKMDLSANNNQPVDTNNITSGDNLVVSAQTFSASGENDLECSSAVTPVKVVSNGKKDEQDDCEIYGATQLSGTKPPKKVKIEPKN